MRTQQFCVFTKETKWRINKYYLNFDKYHNKMILQIEY